MRQIPPRTAAALTAHPHRETWGAGHRRAARWRTRWELSECVRRCSGQCEKADNGQFEMLHGLLLSLPAQRVDPARIFSRRRVGR